MAILNNDDYIMQFSITYVFILDAFTINKENHVKRCFVDIGETYVHKTSSTCCTMHETNYYRVILNRIRLCIRLANLIIVLLFVDLRLAIFFTVSLIIDEKS